MKSYKWIDTTGGPIVILPVSEVKNWSGSFSVKSIEKQEIVFVPENDFLNPNETDYGKACEMENYIGTFDFGKDKAIVLGGDPLTATCLSYNKIDILIVRWGFAESEENVNYCLQSNQIKKIETWSVDEIITVTNGDYVMFDSAEVGFDIDGEELYIFR